jgi:hypothetical protein
MASTMTWYKALTSETDQETKDTLPNTSAIDVRDYRFPCPVAKLTVARVPQNNLPNGSAPEARAAMSGNSPETKHNGRMAHADRRLE